MELWIKLAIQLLFSASIICANSYDVRENIDTLDSVFQSMKDYGSTITAKLDVERKVKQFIAVSVVHPKEINRQIIESEPFRCHPETAPLSKRSSEDLSLECPRMVVLLNKINATSRKHRWHGEIRLLEWGYLNNLINNYTHKYGENTNYIVLLFSHYIPCAMEKSKCMTYKCSEMLRNDKRLPTHQTIIAFSKVYKRTFPKTNQTIETNRTEAIKYMNNLCILEELNGSFKIIVEPQNQNCASNSGKRKRKKRATSSCPRQRTFQNAFFACLWQFPVSLCCTSDDYENRKKIVAYFVNVATYSCVANRTDRGPLTDRTRRDLLECFKRWSAENMGRDCRDCSTKSSNDKEVNEIIVNFCADQSLSLSSYLGSVPSGPSRYDPTYPAWSVLDSAWSLAYQEPPSNFLNRRQMFCANRMLGLDSLCTKDSTLI